MNRSLFHSFKSEGRFWPAGDDSQPRKGLLVYRSGKSLILRLDGPLKSSCTRFNPLTLSRFPIVHGVLIDGTDVTLQDVFCTHQQSGMGGHGSSIMQTRCALVGAHVCDPDAATFRGVEFTTSFLEDWLGASRVRVNHLETQRGGLAFEVNGEDVEAMSEAYGNPPIYARAGVRYTIGQAWRSARIEQKAYVQLEGSHPLRLDEWLSMVGDWGNLLTLLCGEPVHLKRVTLLTGTSSLPVLLEYIAISSRGGAGREDRGIEPVVPYPRIVADMSSILPAWFESCERSRVAMQLFFGVLYAEALPLDFRFLTLAHALEAFHRSTGEGRYMDSNKYKDVAATIVSAFPSTLSDPHRDALKSRVKYGNEYALRKRLSCLLEQMSDAAREMITGGSEGFVQHVVDTRNYLTHYDEELRSSAWRGMDLHCATDQLKLMMAMLLLKVVGLSDSAFLDSLRRGYFGRSLRLRKC